MNKLIELDAALGEYLEFKKLADESVEDIMVGKGNRSLAGEWAGASVADNARLRNRGVKAPAGKRAAARRKEKGMTATRSTLRGRRAYKRGRPLSQGSVDTIESEQAYRRSK